MVIKEIDELVNWVKSNILNIPKTRADMVLKDSSEDPVGSIHTGPELTSAQAKTRLTFADLNAPVEHDFPLSLLEHILGLDRAEN